MNSIIRNIAAGAAFALALGFASQAKALPINGTIEIAAGAGTVVTINFGGNSVSFSNGGAAIVVSTSGDYVAVPNGTGVTYSNFVYDPYIGPATIWSISGSTYFDLNSITDVTEDNAGQFQSLVLGGYGTAYLAGFDPTPGVWTFSADSSTNGAVFSWSSTAAAIPDSGTTAVLIGSGVIGIAIASRRLRGAARIRR